MKIKVKASALVPLLAEGTPKKKIKEIMKKYNIAVKGVWTIKKALQHGRWRVV